ncbi:MAG: SDR family NAD(P)-dependent oxidoreductase [Spirochaetaceae bacterium]
MIRKRDAFWNGKIVIITGSSRGIGKETARLLAKRGAKVVLNGRNEEKLRATTHELYREGCDVTFEAGDVSSRADMDRLVRRAVEAHGRLDVLINNAGLSMRGPFEKISEDLARTLTEVNLLGSLIPTVAALEALTATGGSVAFISSAAGLRGFPNVSIYSATKMALRALAESLNAEVGAKGVHAGVFYLGFTENDPDKEILSAEGEKIRVTRSWQHTQREAAEAIAEAIRRRKPRAVFTASGKLLAAAQRFFPRLVDWAVTRARVHRA